MARQSGQLEAGSGPATPGRAVGVRLWLALAFAAVGIASAALVYLFVSETGEQAANERSSEIAVGRTVNLADRLGASDPELSGSAVATSVGESFAAWSFNRDGELLSSRSVAGISLDDVPDQRLALERALEGGRFGADLEGGITVVSVPVFRDGELSGAVVSHATRPAEVRQAARALGGDRLTALGAAVVLSILIGAFVASLITTRVKRLAGGAAQIAEGRLDIPLEPGGRDEIGDLGRALERMREALRGTFSALSSERDRLSAILEGLTEAVLVVGSGGEVRFSNRAAAPLLDDDGRPIAALESWLRRGGERGAAGHDSLRVGDRVYALQVRGLPAESAVLAVVRDRTEEVRRELAEREFVSNAAHELRNPIAGISGAIEVLRSGAKDDREARDHFLGRLAEDADRLSRLTHSLLTLARIEAIGESEAEVVDVKIAAEEAAQAVAPPDGIELGLELDPDLGARGDPVLLRQVLIGLLTNAFKNTPAPGAVTLRACSGGNDDVLIEVADTGSGIPAEERERVFERFFRGSGSLEQEGFGLGLSIARRMVDLMDGEIGVSSTVGKGSTFWVRLPVPSPAPTPVA